MDLKRGAGLARAAVFVLTAFFAADAAVAMLGSRLPRSVGPSGALGAVAAARATARPGNTRYWITPIRDRDLFGARPPEDATIEAPPTVAGTNTSEDEQLPDSGLRAQGWELVGSVVARDPGLSVAIVAKGREQKLYRIGEVLGSDAEIVGIQTTRIVVRRNGAETELALQVGDAKSGGAGKRPSTLTAANLGAAEPDDDAITHNPDGSYTLDADFVDDQLSDLSRLITEVRAVPNFRDGKTDGFRLFSIKRGSLFDKIGLKNGDVVKQINQHELNDPAVVMQVFQDLRDSRDFQVTVSRNNREETFSYGVR